MQKKNQSGQALIMVFAAVLNTVLVYLFVSGLIKIKPEYGIIGAALATFISRYLNLITLSAFAKKKFGITPNKQSIFKPLIASAIMLGFMVLFIYIFGQSTLSWFIMIICSMIVYWFIIFLLKGVKKEDLEIIKTLIKNKGPEKKK